MACNARTFVRFTKFLLAGVTLFCVSWIACVNEWQGGARWRGRRSPGFTGMSTMRTIVAYSEEKLAEMERPLPVSCDRLPAFPTIPHINRTWSPGSSAEEASWQLVAGTRFSLYGAYYDDRSVQHYVRILARFKGRNISADETLFCQTRSANSYDDFVEVVPAKPTQIWFKGWDPNSTNPETPLLLSCPLTEPINYPSVVSIVTQPCDDPTNAFPLDTSQRELEYNRTFTICVKDMNFNSDISRSLMEWIETNKILRVNKIDIYVGSVTEQMEKVLTFYQKEGYVRLFHVPIKNKPETALWQRRRDHMITYNDCLYRNIQESEYVIPLDVDEILMPKMVRTLPELLKRLTDSGWDKTKKSAILVRNIFFFDSMQGIHRYKLEKTYNNRSEIYIKRDDVRINSFDDTNEIELELVNDSYNLSEEISDNNEDKKLRIVYEKRCGEKFRLPKIARTVVRSSIVSPMFHYCKSLMVTRNTLTVFNHYPLSSLGITGLRAFWPAPVAEVQLNHYKPFCNTTMVLGCEHYTRRARIDRSAWRLRKALTRTIALHAPCALINNTLT